MTKTHKKLRKGKKGDIDLSHYHEDETGWFFYTNGFGERANPYDLSQRKLVESGHFMKSKSYVKFKPNRFKYNNSLNK